MGRPKPRVELSGIAHPDSVEVGLGATRVPVVHVVVIVNPNATTTAPEIHELVIAAMAGAGSVDVVTTTHRGHAVQAAERARTIGASAVIAYGGDGTVNEVLNGMLGHGATGPGPGPDVPALGIIPGGSANVFARNLGLPADPVRAAGRLLWSLRHGARTRKVGLAVAEDRWFAFNAGLGLDAAVVRGVDEARTRGKRATPARYVRTAVRRFFAEDRRTPAITAHLPDGTEQTGLYLALVTNSSPWTYLGSISVRPTPRSSFDAGLDLVALRDLGVLSTCGHAAMIVLTRHGPVGSSVLSRDDLPSIRLTADRPMPMQIDGEYLGSTQALSLRSVPDAVAVLG